MSRQPRNAGAAAATSMSSSGVAATMLLSNNANSLNNNTTTNSGPPSHPSEQNPEHRAFLMRSLERNDVDLAALMELNHSLDSVKNAIIRTCGELTLIHLGQGLLTLDPEGEALQVKSGASMTSDDDSKEQLLPDEGQELCVDFLLRMKLRRKLLNRLARRLNRIAHAMDGNDVAPPGPPRYGDLRLHIDPLEVQAFAELSARQEQAIRRIGQQREKQSMEQYNQRDKSEDVDDEDATDRSANLVSEDEKDNVASQKPTTEEPKRESIPSQEESPPDATESQLKVAELSDKSETTPFDDSPDYDVLRSYDDAYEKKRLEYGSSHKAETSTKLEYAIIDRQVEEDYVKIRYGAGIGATHRSMSAKEKEAEFLRWQTSLLGRIPEQPTFSEIGIENRVFLLEERKERAVREAEQRKAQEQRHADEDDEEMDELTTREGKPTDAESPSSKSSGDKDDTMDTGNDDNNENSDEESSHKAKCDAESIPKATDMASSAKSPSKKDGKDDKDDEGDGKEQEPFVAKSIKPISLAAVPSFYDQDLKRIKLIHDDLMTANMFDHARKRLEDVTKAYNNALRHSNELNSKREQLEIALQRIRYQLQSTSSATAIETWMKGKRQFEEEMLKKFIPSRWGRSPTGTALTQQFGRRPDSESKHVAHCVADIVDSVELMASGQLPNVPKYPYTRPTSDNSQTAVYRNMETQYYHDLSTVKAKLRASEEERHKAWKKMLKTKAEFDLPHHSSAAISNYAAAASARSRVPLNISNYHQVPLPNLRLSMAESIPQEVATARPTVASYIPQRSHISASVARPASESRYSAARVKERIASDGTVAPVSEPKRSKDGLFLRPAGRTRKGMEWDALRGIWVPASSYRADE